MSTTGGYSSITISASFDFEIFAENPKPIVGFSDSSALLLALYARTGVVTFHGPALLPSMGELVFNRANWESLMAVVSGVYGANLIERPSVVHRTFRCWDRDDEEPPAPEPAPPLVCLRPGIVEGPLIGGNLDTLLAIAATPYLPDLRGAVLFWEVAFSSANKLQRDLACLEAAGIFGLVSGMIVGASFQLSDGDDTLVFALAREVATRHRLPAIAGAFIGHCQPIATLPIGGLVRFDAENGSVVLLEPAVSGPARS